MIKAATKDVIPMELEVVDLIDKSLPDPLLFDYYNRLSRREIFLNAQIDVECVDYAKQIIDWNYDDKDIPVEKRKPIKIYINSPGGIVSSAFSLIDAMLISETPIITIGMGIVYSAASMIFVAGHKRLVFPHSTFMIHDGYTMQSNSTAKVLDDLEFTKKNEMETKKYYLERTKISSKLYDSKYRVDWYMDSDEMLQYGIADAIVTKLSEV